MVIRGRRPGGRFGERVLQTVKLCVAGFVEASQPLRRILRQLGASRIGVARRFDASVQTIAASFGGACAAGARGGEQRDDNEP